MSIKAMSKEDIIKFIQKEYSNKEFTNQADFRAKYETYYKRIMKLFNCLADALDEAGIAHNIQRTYTKKDIESYLRKVSAEHGELSGPLLKKLGGISIDAVSKRFGSLRKACELFSLPYKERNHKWITKEELDKEIFRINDEFGYVSKPLMEKHSIYGPKIVNRIYGSFGEMYKALGLERHPSGRSPSREDLIREFLRINNRYGTATQSIIARESKYSTTCYKDRFGSFNKLREELGLPIVLAGEEHDANYALQKVSEYIGEEPIKEKKFDWLKNPQNGYSLRIDGYFENHKLAVEYNGPQHYELDTQYMPTEKHLEHRKYLDALKEQLCSEHGIKVVWISYLDKIDDEYLESTFK